MKRNFIGAFAIGVSLFAGSSIAVAQPGSASSSVADLGKGEYDAKCASCHGTAGKADGPVARYLTKKPTDLTTLAKANNDVFPVARMYDIIAGSAEVPAHGTRTMPVWGRAFRIQAGEHFVDVPYDEEAYVRGRILALIEYIYRLQAK